MEGLPRRWTFHRSSTVIGRLADWACAEVQKARAARRAKWARGMVGPFAARVGRTLNVNGQGSYTVGGDGCRSESAAATLLRRQHLQTGRPPTGQDRLDKLFGQSLLTHLVGQA